MIPVRCSRAFTWPVLGPQAFFELLVVTLAAERRIQRLRFERWSESIDESLSARWVYLEPPVGVPCLEAYR